VRSRDLAELALLGRLEAVMVSPTRTGVRELATRADVVETLDGTTLATHDGITFALEHEPAIVLTWRTLPALLWTPRGSALVWGPGSALEAPVLEEGEPQGEAAQTWRRWTRGRAPSLVGDVDVDLVDTRWRAIGPAGRLDYRSSKFNSRGHEVLYRHEHGRGVELFHCRIHGADLWALQGGRLRITSRGVEG